MLFRRRVDEGSQWVAVARAGALLHAAQVRQRSGQMPQLMWLWQGEQGDLTEGLRALQGARRLRGLPLSVLLDRSEYRLVSTEVPDLPREEWRDAMRWRLKDLVDLPMEDALLDILAVPGDTQLRQSHPAFAVVAQRVDCLRLQLAADDVGLRWAAADVAETALRNLCNLRETEGQAHALMVFGETHGMLVITYKGELLMTRNIEVAVSSVTGSQEARGAALGRAALEVLRTLDTFERIHSQAALSALSVVSPDGGTDVLEVLADLVYVPVQPFHLSEWIDLSPLGADAERLSSAPTLDELCVIGSALRGHAATLGRQPLNLLDTLSPLGASAGLWSARNGMKLAAGVAGLALAAGAGFSSAAQWFQRKVPLLQGEVLALKEQVQQQQVPPAVKELEALRAREAAARQMRDAMYRVASPQSMAYSDYLIALARQTHPAVWITGLTVDRQGADVAITGRMTDPETLPVYLGRLEQEPQFKGRRFAQVELRTLEPTDEGQPEVIEFNLRGQPPKDALTAKDSP